MKHLFQQLRRGRLPEKSADLFDLVAVSRDDQMRVARKNGTRMDSVSGFLHLIAESDADGQRLMPGEHNGRIFHHLFRREAAAPVVRHMGDRTGVSDQRRRAESAERLVSDFGRPRPAGIVREPESVCRHDDVVGDDRKHGELPWRFDEASLTTFVSDASQKRHLTFWLNK
jgi:hypothetical protein